MTARSTITFATPRPRGGVHRFRMGKNMWKFDFNRTRGFEARNDYGEKYKTQWDKLNFSALIQQGNFQQRGEQGLFEAAGFKLHNLADSPAPHSHYVHFRIVEDADENGPTASQYDDDFQGLYLAIEQMDGEFLKEHDLPDANLYKMEAGTGELNNQGRDQPSDKADLNAFLSAFDGAATQDETWWRANLDLDSWYNFSPSLPPFTTTIFTRIKTTFSSIIPRLSVATAQLGPRPLLDHYLPAQQCTR